MFTEDFEIWLAEVEAQLMSEDYGKDLTSVQNLQKKHALLEADITSRQVRLERCYIYSRGVNFPVVLFSYFSTFQLLECVKIEFL